MPSLFSQLRVFQFISLPQILTSLNVVIPLKDLLQMFHRGVESLKDPIPLVDAGSTTHSSVTEMMDPTEDSLIGSDDAGSHQTAPIITAASETPAEEQQPAGPTFDVLNCLNMMLKIAKGQVGGERIFSFRCPKPELMDLS